MIIEEQTKMTKDVYIAVLLTVYNRKETTIKGLKSLYANISSFPKNYHYDIYMVDDGCSDGTSETVKNLYPFVNIIEGNGSLYWGGGMNEAWKTAAKSRDYNYFLWFNDDVILYPNALVSLFSIMNEENDNVIVSGVFEDENHIISYGGKDKTTKLLPLGSTKDVFYMNGNLVLIPNIIFKEVGFLDTTFIHGHGDYDYGLRAKAKGFKIRLTENYVGLCSRHDKESRKFLDKNVPLKKRFHILYSKKTSPFITFKFHLRHRGLFFAICKFFRINFATLFPSIYNALR